MSPNIALNQLYSFYIFFFMLIYTLNSHFSRNSSFISYLAPSSRTSRTRSSRASSWGAQKTFTPSIGLASPKTFSQVIWTCSYSLNYLRTSYNQLSKFYVVQAPLSGEDWKSKVVMDKLQLTGRNLSLVFNLKSRVLIKKNCISYSRKLGPHNL